jgi:hypothetical protein
MRRKIFNNSGIKLKKGQAVHVDKIGTIKGVNTSKFKKGDILILDPDKPGTLKAKQNMKADAWTAGLMFLGHILMICFWDYYENSVPYNIMLIIFALAAWFFSGRVIIHKIEKDAKNN